MFRRGACFVFFSVVFRLIFIIMQLIRSTGMVSSKRSFLDYRVSDNGRASALYNQKVMDGHPCQLFKTADGYLVRVFG